MGNNPPSIDSISLAERLVAGETQTSIAQSIGVTPSRICQQANNPKTKAIIDQLSEQMVKDKLSKAYSNLSDSIDNYIPRSTDYTPLTDDHGRANGLIMYQGRVYAQDIHKTLIQQGYKASVKVMESVGILPSQSPSYFFQTLVQQSNTQVVLPGIAALLSNLLGIQPTNAEVIDIDPVQALKDMDAG